MFGNSLSGGKKKNKTHRNNICVWNLNRRKNQTKTLQKELLNGSNIEMELKASEASRKHCAGKSFRLSTCNYAKL